MARRMITRWHSHPITGGRRCTIRPHPPKYIRVALQKMAVTLRAVTYSHRRPWRLQASPMSRLRQGQAVLGLVKYVVQQ